MTTSRDLLELIADFVEARSGDGSSADELQAIAQRFDVALTEAVIDRASVQNEA
ncbi:hypothetical protein [Klenkia taihuensis]|uniref:Uncharacterized protein n=1 Tax=Klenkia taihuensis TaxID=1225127 RepID=A0A1I1NVN5_9ACTN|nr:hypothetical protein [Klenkia taihuensis]SFD01744.1 hypothetical protein SAMN05661030_2296 [Klenkia taihuensis]